MKSFKMFSRETPATPTDLESQDTAPRIVQMPLSDLIDSLALVAALKSEADRWVEIVNFPEYHTFSVEFLERRGESGSASQPEGEEAVVG